jgi:CDP-diacylglycerol--glycerol-3-phosphate 3-phosphatidyltransferase
MQWRMGSGVSESLGPTAGDGVFSSKAGGPGGMPPGANGFPGWTGRAAAPPRLPSPELPRVFARLCAHMNLPNLLTISRVPLMFIVVGLMYAEFAYAATIAFWLFIAAALTDWLDGKLARERGEVSPFGRFMDSVIDKVMVIGLMIALVNEAANFMGHVITAMMLLLCILCREFAISGLRMVAATKGLVVEADTGGKVKTFVQLNAIGWLIGARMLQRDFDFHATDPILRGVRLFGIALFALSAVLTITSGVSYFRKHGRVLFS